MYLRLAQHKAEQAPDDWRSWYHLGAELQTQMRHKEAVESYEKALRIIQDFAPLWRELGISRLVVGDVTGALKAFGESITIDPTNAVSWTLLGAAFLDLGHLDDAENCYQTILASDPSNLAAQGQLAIVKAKKAERDK
jgi:tetratricopeptide (TPR) repeat protein